MRRAAAEERIWGGNAFYRIYRCGDGEELVLGGVEMKFVRALLTALGARNSSELQRPGVQAGTGRRLPRGDLRSRPRAHWLEFIDGPRRLLRAGERSARGACHRPRADARDAGNGARRCRRTGRASTSAGAAQVLGAIGEPGARPTLRRAPGTCTVRIPMHLLAELGYDARCGRRAARRRAGWG